MWKNQGSWNFFHTKLIPNSSIVCTKVETECALLALSPGGGGSGVGTGGHSGGGGGVTPPSGGGSAKPGFFFDEEQEDSYED